LVLNKYLVGFKKYSFLLSELTKKGIKLRYRRSYLGIVWTLLDPLFTMLVLTLVFGTILGRSDPTFPLYILSGRLIYNSFSQGTRTAMKSIRGNSGMIKKVYVPKYFYPLSSVLYNYIIFLISLMILAGTMFVLKVYPTFYLIQIIVPLVLLLLLTFGVGLILACITVFFKDIEYLWDVALMLIMYTSAIFYHVDQLKGSRIYNVFYCNPLYAIIRLFRSAVYGVPMEPVWLIIASVAAVGSVLAGLAIFYWKQDEFILHI